MSEQELNTEGPTPSNEAAPAGGVDLARDAARAAETEGAETPQSTPAPAPDAVQDPSADDVTTSGEPQERAAETTGEDDTVVDEAPETEVPDTETPSEETAQ